MSPRKIAHRPKKRLVLRMRVVIRIISDNPPPKIKKIPTVDPSKMFPIHVAVCLSGWLTLGSADVKNFLGIITRTR